jgi:hypothetical protein
VGRRPKSPAVPFKMAGKKIDKPYCLSDDSVNVYGFRLLTSGYQIEEYRKNPIGYYMHDRSCGVVVKWEDLTIQGEKVYGTPVINMAHERGQQTVDEVEGGFLNAASVGHIVVLEYSDEPAMKLPGQSGPTITKWYNRECSLVDVPGNNNALTDLYDMGGNSLKLSDLCAKSTTDLTNGNMKQLTLTLSAGLYAALGLAATATPADVEAKLPDLVAKANRADQLEIDKVTLAAERDAAQLKYDTLVNTTVKTQVADLLAKALADKKVTVEVKNRLASDYATNPEGLKLLLDGMAVYTPLTAALKADDEAKAKQYAGKKWDDLFEAGLTDALKADCPQLYKELYKAEYGNEPKM